MAGSPDPLRDAPKLIALVVAVYAAVAVTGVVSHAVAAALEAAVFVLLLLPLWLMLARKLGPRIAIGAAVTVALWSATTSALYFLPRPGFIKVYTVTGKLAAIALSLVAIQWLTPSTWAEYGITFRQRIGTNRRARALVLGIVFSLVALAFVLIASGIVSTDAIAAMDDGAPFWEAFFYQFFLVGISEELVYRGFLQSYLDRRLPGTRRVLGAELGWGFLITAVLFWLGHLVVIQTAPVRITFEPYAIPMVLPMSFLFGYLRSYTGSLLWPIALHGLSDGLGVLVPAIVHRLNAPP